MILFKMAAIPVLLFCTRKEHDAFSINSSIFYNPIE